MNKAKRFCIISGLLVVTALLTGCSGINYSHSVSPADFILPGLVNNGHPDTIPPNVSEETPSVLIAQNLR